MRISPAFRLIVLAVLLSLGIGTLFVHAMLTIRDDEWNYARTTNINLAQALEKSVTRTLNSLERSMVGLAESTNQPDVMALPPNLRAQILFDYSLRSSAVAAVSLSDAHGNIVQDSDGPLITPINIAATDYFAAHSSGAHQGVYVGRPQTMGKSNVLALPISRAYFDRQGYFAGVVVVAVRLSYFDELLSALNLGAKSGANLIRNDGVILARFPYSGADAGRSIAGTPNMKHMLASDNGLFVGTATLDGVQRMYAFRHVGSYPLIINVAQATDTILAHWRRSAWRLGSFALVLMAACIGLAVLFGRELAARQQVSGQLRQAERDLHTILDNLPSMVSYWDREQCSRFANHAYQNWFGVTAEMLHKTHISQVLDPVAYAQSLPYIEKALQGQQQLFERTMRNAHGHERFTIVSYVPDMESAPEGAPDSAPVVRGVFVQITDITERKRMENELFEEKERMRLTLQSIGDAVLCTDAQACITYLNPMAERMTGWQAFAAAGQHIDKVAPLRVAGRSTTEASPLCQALQQARTFGPTRGVVLQRADGRVFDVEESASPITDRHGQVTGAVMVLHDITESAAMASRLAHLAHYDALTDLPNRVLLRERAYQALALAQRGGHQVALLYFDLDGFKQINDTLGHDTGDLLLIEFARRLSAVVRQSDTVCRQGGDEFIALLPGLDSMEQACVVARKILAICAQPLQVQQRALAVGVSGGIAMYPQHGATFEELATHADAAMYAAKRAGRMQFRLFSAAEGEFERVADAA